MKHDENNNQKATSGQGMLPPSNPNDPSRLSSFALDRLHVGEVNEAEREAMQAQLDAPALQAQLRERQSRFAELGARPDFAAFLDQQAARFEALAALPHDADAIDTPAPARASVPAQASWFEQAMAWFSWQGMTAMMAACVMLLVFASLPAEQIPFQEKRTATQEAKWKGGCKGGCLDASHTMFRVMYFRKGAPYPLWLRNKQTLRPGDLIQFSLRVSRQPAHVMIVGMNQRGERYAFVPYQGKQSLRVTSGTLRLPQHSSLELDDYLGPERFYFFSSTTPFTLAQVKQAMASAFLTSGKAIEQLDAIPGPWQSRSLLIYKRKR